MLEAALKYQKAFEELEMQDKKYPEELEKGKGVPTYGDWEFVRVILPFFKLFYDATLCTSGSAYVTCNMYLFEVFGIGRKIKQMCTSNNVRGSIMAENIKKYGKYWGNPDHLNMFVLIALVMHPRYKLQFMHWLINQSFNGDVTFNLKDKVESSLRSLFEEYNGGRVLTQKKLSLMKEQLNPGRFPILANVARDLPAISVSTVAFESSSYTANGGNTCLQQDWLKETPSLLSSNENEDFEEFEKFEQKES
ncbi:Zinc finger BED domain-containing protein RICESLEEPER 2, partial [Mucuna pruriens]